jgi:hypothetical protein
MMPSPYAEADTQGFLPASPRALEDVGQKVVLMQH